MKQRYKTSKRYSPSTTETEELSLATHTDHETESEAPDKADRLSLRRAMFNPTIDGIRQLQQNYGNRAVARWLAPQREVRQVASGTNQVQRTAIDSTKPTMIQRVLNEYDFDDAGVEELNNSKVYKITTQTGQMVVLKAIAGKDAFSAMVAERTGIRAPQYRHPSDAEVAVLKGVSNMLKSVNTNWYLMDFVTGQNLDHIAEEAFSSEQRNFLTSAQLKDLGASIAFQILIDGWDRWDMPYAGKAKGQYNMGNIMIDHDSNINLIDSDLQGVRLNQEDHSEEVRFYLEAVFKEAGGGAIIQNAVKRLQGNFFEIRDEETQDLQTGFMDYVKGLQGTDFSDLDGSLAGLQGESRVEALQQMKTLMVDQMEQSLEPYAKRGKKGRAKAKNQFKEPRARGKKKCYITTACVTVKGLPDDCEELTVLRTFRDQYLLARPNGPALVEIYYRYSPSIVAAVNAQPNRLEIYTQLYEVISHCVDLIKQQENEAAYRVYVEMVLNLKRQYLKTDSINETLYAAYL